MIDSLVCLYLLLLQWKMRCTLELNVIVCFFVSPFFFFFYAGKISNCSAGSDWVLTLSRPFISASLLHFIVFVVYWLFMIGISFCYFLQSQSTISKELENLLHFLPDKKQRELKSNRIEANRLNAQCSNNMSLESSTMPMMPMIGAHHQLNIHRHHQHHHPQHPHHLFTPHPHPLHHPLHHYQQPQQQQHQHQIIPPAAIKLESSSNKQSFGNMSTTSSASSSSSSSSTCSSSSSSSLKSSMPLSAGTGYKMNKLKKHASTKSGINSGSSSSSGLHVSNKVSDYRKVGFPSLTTILKSLTCWHLFLQFLFLQFQ